MPESMEDSFFKGKRPWSKIKDQVLSDYMPPYLSKVAKLRRPIVLIDAFAGPGKFEDGTAGSPLILCQKAEQYAQNQYKAIFVNREKKQHDKLSSVLSEFIEQGKVATIHGTAENLLAKVQNDLKDHTVFLFLDPFGLRGCEFSVIEPFLRRNKAYSTELVINLSVPIMHRLATRKAVAEGRADTPQNQKFHDRLTRVLGGDYWKEILWDDLKSPEAKIEKVMEKYRNKILGYDFPFNGSCPVRENARTGIKYYITFCSRHQDAMLLMNDIMCKSYFNRMHEAATEGTLFENTNWKDERGTDNLSEIVLKIVGELPGRSRKGLWEPLKTT
jgi:three-Cys-motif partner protein